MMEFLIALLHLILAALLAQIESSLAIFAAMLQVIPFALWCFAGYSKWNRQ
jgi:hypothetical protein